MRHPFLLSLLSVPLLAAPPARAQMAAPAVLPPVVSTQTAAVPGLMDALLKQKISPQDLWEGGQLNADSLTAVLNEQPWGRTENQPLASQLCAMIVEKTPEKLKTPLALPPRVRLRLAQYFAQIKDARAVTFYEAILSLIKAPREAGVREVFDLSDYYSSIGDWEKAAETRLRMKDYTTAEPYLANANVEAARMYLEHGEIEKAKPLYERAQKSSYGWAAGMAIYDQGIQLIGQGKYKEAIEVLSKPVEGLYADQVQVGILSTLGYAYLMDGDIESARRVSQEAVDAYEETKDPLQGEGLEDMEASAKEYIRLIDEWKNKIFVVPLKKPLVTCDENGVYHAKIYVQSFIKAQPVTVRFENPDVQLIGLSLKEQHRTNEGVMVERYELTYKVEQHPAGLKVWVSAQFNPKEQQIINIRYLE